MSERLNANATPLSAMDVPCTPQELRIIADRLEAKVATTFPGQKITYQATQGIVFEWRPEQARTRVTGFDSDDKTAAIEAQSVSTAIS